MNISIINYIFYCIWLLKSRISLSMLSKDTKEVFAELPGLADAIRVTDRNTLLVPFVAVFPVSSSMLGYFGQYRVFRTILGYVRASIFTLKSLFKFLSFHFRIISKIMSPNQVMNLWPRYGLVVEYDLSGNALRSWHDTTGKKVPSVTSAVLHDNKLYLGSYDSAYIAVVDYQ
jgi:hypothetical protein